MFYERLKLKLAILLLSGLPLFSYAEDTSKPYSDNLSKTKETFQSICLGSWMKRFNDIKDEVSYKNFGEKYCSCAQTQPLDSDDAVDKAIQVCMSRILLRDSMDSLAKAIGLAKATEKDVAQYCQDKWGLIYPQMTDQAKQATSAYCECSKGKLVDLFKKVKQTDPDYYDQIDSIAASCSPEIKSSDSSASAPKS